jgi:hypothetical protein
MNKFEILTPLGFRVRTSEEYWQKLIIKHPDIAELEAEVTQTLTNPDEIRQSRRDPNIVLFYLTLKAKRWVVAVARRLNGDGFLITAYQTDAIKEGDLIWHR